MTLPELVRDGGGRHLIWGQWMVSRFRYIGPKRWRHITYHAHMGETQIDQWFWLGWRVIRVQHR